MIKVIGVKYYFSIRVGGIIGVSAAHCQKATETMLRNGNKKMHHCCVYQNMYPYVGNIRRIVFCVFGRSMFVAYICFTTRSLQYPDWCCFQKSKDGSKY